MEAGTYYDKNIVGLLEVVSDNDWSDVFLMHDCGMSLDHVVVAC